MFTRRSLGIPPGAQERRGYGMDSLGNEAGKAMLGGFLRVDEQLRAARQGPICSPTKTTMNGMEQ